MFYRLIPKAKPRTTSPNVFCLGHQPSFSWGGHWPALLHKNTLKFKVILLRSVAFHNCNNAKFDLLCPLCRTWEKCCTPWSWVWVAFWAEDEACIMFLWLKSSPPSLAPVWSRKWALLGEATAKGNWRIADYVMEGSKLTTEAVLPEEKLAFLPKW